MNPHVVKCSSIGCLVGPEVLIPENSWPASRLVGEGARPLLQAIFADGRPLSEKFDSLHCISTQQHESAVLPNLLPSSFYAAHHSGHLTSALEPCATYVQAVLPNGWDAHHSEHSLPLGFATFLCPMILVSHIFSSEASTNLGLVPNCISMQKIEFLGSRYLLCWCCLTLCPLVQNRILQHC